MWHDAWAGFSDLMGKGEDDLAPWEMALRALVIYVCAIALIRLGEKRFMGKNTALDLILGIMIGSVLSRAITGNAPFLPTVAAAAALVAVHALFAILSFHFSRFGRLVKGRERLLIQDGRVLEDNMRKSHITAHDLEYALYANGGVTDPAQVRTARLERNGNISIITRPPAAKPHVVEVAVHDGVQTIRVEIR